MTFIFQQLLFFTSIILVLFVPGYFLILAIWGKSKTFSDLEKLIIAFGLSIVTLNFLIILLGKIGIKINTLSIAIMIILFSVICIGIYKLRSGNFSRLAKKLPANFLKIFAPYSSQDHTPQNNFTGNFSKNQTILIILILFLTIFIKTIYLSGTIFPTSTDMGHHMYWSKLVSETGQLPLYEERDIIETNGNYQISEPRPIADFIIGEHLIFAAINLLSGADFISAFPSLILFLIHIFGILTIFVLTLQLFRFQDFPQGKNIAIFSLFLLGPLFAISSSQAKFVSGGVIGNTLGNLLIPLSLYFYLRALQTKNTQLLALGIFSTAGLFYVHHLSGLIFLYILSFSAITFSLLNLKKIPFYFREWKKIFLSPAALYCLGGCLLFAIIIHTPSYLKISAVETVIGGPSKSTRAGLTFNQLSFTVGEARMALGITGLLLFFSLKSRKTYSTSILGGWTIALLMMSLKPHWLYLDIPSGRIANYTSFPLVILGAFAFVWVFNRAQDNLYGKLRLNARILFSLFILLVSFAAFNGSYDNSQSLPTKNNFNEAVQTFHASKYLAKKTNQQSDVILKDHNYLTADAWIKLFYMRDYNYPLSRGFFKRYEDETKQREMCTLWMISTPNSTDGKKCLSETGTNYILVNPAFDGPQFEKLRNFWKPYAGKDISIYHKIND